MHKSKNMENALSMCEENLKEMIKEIKEQIQR